MIYMKGEKMVILPEEREEIKRVLLIDPNSLKIIYDTCDTKNIEEKIEEVTRRKTTIVLTVGKGKTNIYCYEKRQELPTISITLLTSLIGVEFDEVTDMLGQCINPQKAMTLLAFALSLLNLS